MLQLLLSVLGQNEKKLQRKVVEAELISVNLIVTVYSMCNYSKFKVLSGNTNAFVRQLKRKKENEENTSTEQNLNQGTEMAKKPCGVGPADQSILQR